MEKTLIAKIGKYDVTHEDCVFEPGVKHYFVSIVLNDNYRHYIFAHALESEALKKAQQLQEKANEYATR